ncbi:MAG: signal peptidase II [Dehalococcoidales bacterium]|nr:signal peptidase II [Dehalococcoidales bacterium]
MLKHKLPQYKWHSLFFGIALLLAVADQLSKWWIQSILEPGQSLPATGFFRLTYARNTGAAFSIFYGNNDILIVASSLGILLLLFYYFYLSRRYPILETSLNKIALAVIFGGTVGNLIDRASLGFVRDFIDVGPWPIFNIADSCTVVGVIVFAFSLLLLNSKTVPPEQG